VSLFFIIQVVDWLMLFLDTITIWPQRSRGLGVSSVLLGAFVDSAVRIARFAVSDHQIMVHGDCVHAVPRG
jgi:hypothetical protein